MAERNWQRAIQVGACAGILGSSLLPGVAPNAKTPLQATPADQGAYWPDAGTVKGNLYINSLFGSSVELPKGWKILDKDQLHNLQGRIVDRSQRYCSTRQSSLNRMKWRACFGL
jgi:hypothetical protein